MYNDAVTVVESKTINSQVKSGFRLAGNVLLTITTAALLFVGVAQIFIPSLVNPESRSPVLGWVFLIIATTILVWKMDRWVTVLPGILGYAAFGGMLAIVSGHLPNNPSTPMSRTDAAVVTSLLLVSSGVSFTFGKRTLNVVDRIALLVFVFSVAFSTSPGRSKIFLAQSIGLASLLFAWAYHRIAGPTV
jgi:hypothetical protein